MAKISPEKNRDRTYVMIRGTFQILGLIAARYQIYVYSLPVVGDFAPSIIEIGETIFKVESECICIIYAIKAGEFCYVNDYDRDW